MNTTKIDSKLKVKIYDILNSAEIYILFLAVVYIVLLAVFHAHFANWAVLLNYNIGIIGILLASAFIDFYFDHNTLTRIFRLSVISVLVYLSYLNTQNYVKVLNPYYYDSVLIGWDNAIFGGSPERFFNPIRNPLLTEFLQICYVLFYFLPIIHGVELFARHKENELNDLTNQIVFAFIVSYMCYFAMPAIGPRFTVFDFQMTDHDLPGLYFTHYLRDFINNGGGIPAGGTSHPELYVNRDCMASGHTWITIVNLILAFKYRSKLRYVICIIGISLITATIYMRYHYGVDIIAGLALGFLTLYLEPKVVRLLKKDRSNAKCQVIREQ